MAGYLIQGKGYWVKVLGAPHPGYTEGDKSLAPKEWSMDLSLDKAAIQQATSLKIISKTRNVGDDRGTFLTFRRREFKGDGVTRNQPIKVVDHQGAPWDPKKLIGNGSTLNVNFKLFEGRKGPKPIILAIQVWDHVEYVGKDAFPRKKMKTEEDFSESTDDVVTETEEEIA